jgi:hypothetical protein
LPILNKSIIIKEARLCFSIGIIIISPSSGAASFDKAFLFVKYASNAIADEPVIT